MLQHIIAFSLYTLAMIGIFFIAFVVYKKTMNQNDGKFNRGMKIEDMLRLSQRKTLYIINVQGERFLIASDLENTTFLAKLASKDDRPITRIGSSDKKETTEPKSNEIENYIKNLEPEKDYSNAVDIKSKSTVMKNILRELENSKRTNI